MENGTTCVLAPMPDSPLTCLDLWCKAGSAFEEIGEEGLAHFLEHMVFKGSNCLEAGEFDLQIEALGGSSNAATGFDDVHFHVLVPPKVIEPALELLINLVMSPSLKPDAFATEREVVLEELAQYKDQPDEQVFQALLETCWGNHSYGRSILGYEKSLKEITPQRMHQFHKRLYKPKNLCLSIAGEIPTRLKESLNTSYLAQLEISSKEKGSYEKFEDLIFHQKRKEVEVSRLESSRLLMAWEMPPAKEQIMVMGTDIAISLLAEGRCSRLVKRLREDLQIVESIDMDVTPLEQGGLILLETYCKEEHLERIEQEINTVLRSSYEDPLSIREINRAKLLVKNGICFNLEASSQVAGIAGNQSLWNRHQPLLEPIQLIEYWTEDNLQNEILSSIQPELSCTLIARSHN